MEINFYYTQHGTWYEVLLFGGYSFYMSQGKANTESNLREAFLPLEKVTVRFLHHHSLQKFIDSG